MARLGEHTKLIAVNEGKKVHIKIYYSREGIKRYKTNVFIKDRNQFLKDKGFKKNNAISPTTFQDDKNKIDALQLKIETLIETFIAEHLQKPTANQLDHLIDSFKENSQNSYTYVGDYLNDYTHSFDGKDRNSKSVIRAFDSAMAQFVSYKNRKYYFNEIDKKFIEDFIKFMLFYKPKRQTEAILSKEPKHILPAPKENAYDKASFDEEFGMNNNTLLKRLDAFRAFLLWAVNEKKVNIDYAKIRKTINDVIKNNNINEYSNTEFAFRDIEIVRKLGSPEFEESIKDDIYPEKQNDLIINRGVSKDILIRTKDYFIISIFTGNRVSDLRAIKKHHINLGKQTAKKTNGEFFLNSNDSVRALLEKHNYNMNMSDAKYNKCIKVVLKQFYQNFLKQEVKLVVQREKRGKYEEVKEVPYYMLAASHSGRRSFATIAYHSGRMSKKSIMQFTGHTSETEFDKYIQLDPENDIEVFADLMSL